MIIARRQRLAADPWKVKVKISQEKALMVVWEKGTREGHGAGLIRYAEWCQICEIPEIDRFPVTSALVGGFIGWAAGQMGTSAARGWMAGLRAWHIFHEFPWIGDTDAGAATIQTAMVAVGKLTPQASKQEPREPVTTAHLKALGENLDFESSFDIAVWAIACVAFWALGRLGELTVPSIAEWDVAKYPTVSTKMEWSSREMENVEDVPYASFHIPWTKTTQNRGATLHITSEANELSCPYDALYGQMKANADHMPRDAHLFGFLTKDGGWEPMLKSSFMERCEDIWKKTKMTGPKGHSFRIGGTSHHLARGMDVQVLQKLGRWSSDAFFLYWRNTQAIISLHVASAAKRETMRTRVEAYLEEGADREVVEAWKDMEAQRIIARSHKPKRGR